MTDLAAAGDIVLSAPSLYPAPLNSPANRRQIAQLYAEHLAWLRYDPGQPFLNGR